jgi:hypothetical protein
MPIDNLLPVRILEIVIKIESFAYDTIDVQKLTMLHAKVQRNPSADLGVK